MADPPTASTPKPPPLLLTSFQTWLPHQRSNASDDLLLALQDLTTHRALAGQDLARQESGDRTPGLGHCILLRNLPVSFEAAPAAVRRAIAQYHPWAIVACGMAEGRSHLTLEWHGRQGDQVFTTPFPIADLCQHLPVTIPSDDAGTFVCNGLYAALLADYHRHLPAIGAKPPPIAPPPLFIHVPPLTATNRRAILADFQTVLLRLTHLYPHPSAPAAPPTSETAQHHPLH